VPSGASPLFCFWRGYGLWVMGYVLCLTHNLYPPSRFPILHPSGRPSGRPSACASPLAVVGGIRAAGWHSEAVGEIAEPRLVPQSVPQSVARTATAGKRSQSGGKSGGKSVRVAPTKGGQRAVERCPPHHRHGTQRGHYERNNHTARVGFSPSVRRASVRRRRSRHRRSQRRRAIPRNGGTLRGTPDGSPRSPSVRGSYGSSPRTAPRGGSVNEIQPVATMLFIFATWVIVAVAWRRS